MNIRTFSIALLISALPISVQAYSKKIPLDKGDFIAAEKITRSGKSVVSVKLSKSGKAKLKKIYRAGL